MKCPTTKKLKGVKQKTSQCWRKVVVSRKKQKSFKLWRNVRNLETTNKGLLQELFDAELFLSCFFSPRISFVFRERKRQKFFKKIRHASFAATFFYRWGRIWGKKLSELPNMLLLGDIFCNVLCWHTTFPPRMTQRASFLRWKWKYQKKRPEARVKSKQSWFDSTTR